MKKASLAVTLFTAVALLAASRASATFHIMVIDQMFPGFTEAPQAQYVMLHTQAAVQTLVHGQPLPMLGASGNSLGSFGTFCTTANTCDLPKVSPACSAGGCPSAIASNDRRILVATPWAQGLFCVTADLLATQLLPYPDGRVCFGDCSVQPGLCPAGPVDCVAYGDFTGNNGVFGSPAVSPMLGEALVASPDRKNQFLNGGNLLDNAVGFSIGMPTPRNFHGDMGALDGVAGDPEGTGVLDEDDIAAEVNVLFEADRRCALPAARRGADANLDTRVNAADVIATIQIVNAAG